MSKFTKGPFETMANMPESVCKRNEDGSLRWGCRIRPFVGYEVCSDESARRKECVTVATLFQAAPDLYEVLKAVEWKGHDYDFDEPCCPICHASCGDDHEPDCALNNALLKAGGEG